MLDPFSRGVILVLSALCVVCAVELAPAPARGFFDAAERRSAHPSVASAAMTAGAVAVVRDPFTEPAPRNATPANAVAPTTPVQRGTIGVLPSNLPSDTIPALPGMGGTRITAIVTGAHPFAMVESGGNHEIKGIGDRIDGIPVVAIDLDGIRLQTGGRLSIDPAGRP